MFKKMGIVALLAVVCVLMVVPSSFAERKRLKKPSERSFEVKQSNFILVPHIHVGYLTGEASDLIDSVSSRGADKAILAAAVTLEYLPYDHLSVHGTLERAWKDLPDDYPTITGWSLGVGLQYRLLSTGKRSPFLRIEGGHIWGSADGYDNEGENYWRIGVGMFEYTTPATNLRLEFFYRSILSKKNEVFAGNFGVDGFNVEYIGVDFGVGFNL